MKRDMTDRRFDVVAGKLAAVREQLASACVLLERLTAQVNEHNAVLTRMCHGPIAELPPEGRFGFMLQDKQWYISGMGSSMGPDKAYYWLAWKGPHAREETGLRSGYASNPAAAMDEIRKALAELGVSP